jgi:hypothetical protein
MHIYLIPSPNIGIGVTSFGESVFSAWFIQKTTKGDLFVKRNHIIPQRNRRGKTLEGNPRKMTARDLQVRPAGF